MGRDYAGARSSRARRAAPVCCSTSAPTRSISCMSVFGDLSAVDYSDDAAGGVETNVAMRLASAHCKGSLDLSWDVPQVNELRVVGSRRRRCCASTVSISSHSGAAARSCRRRSHCLSRSTWSAPCRTASCRSVIRMRCLCQIVQMLRAIALGERPAVDGTSGAACIALIEQALSKAAPLPQPWLTPREQTAAAALHGSAR